MEKVKDTIRNIFNGRVEEIASLTDSEKKELSEKKDIIYIEDYVKGLTPEQKKQIAEYFDDAISEVYDESARMNEKYYKYGFSDGMNATIESFKLRPEIERRFSKWQILKLADKWYKFNNYFMELILDISALFFIQKWKGSDKNALCNFKI